MNRLVDAALVIARRDFVATIFSRTFLLFLFAPLIALAFGLLITKMTRSADQEARRPVVALVTELRTVEALQASWQRLVPAFGEEALPELRRVDPAADVETQVAGLLADPEGRVSAVFTGSLERPVLRGPDSALDATGETLRLIVADARRGTALSGARLPDREVELATVATGQSAGNLERVRRDLARGGQLLILLLTMILAGLMLSNLVEEKSNKVVEVLAAAVPLDAIFLGKLVAMLGVSLVAIAIWGGMALFGWFFIERFVTTPVGPAVGWPAYVLFIFVYFITNYLLLGAVFLGVGGQANSMREVQTLSMPVTFAQVAIFFLGSAAITDPGSPMATAAYLVPFSATLAMVGEAALSPTLWPHALSLLWQLLWTAIVIRFTARLFRRRVLKSQVTDGFFDFLKPKRA